MLDAAAFRELVSGRRRGIGAGAARGLLRLVEAPYRLVVEWRNRHYDDGRWAIERVGVPVVSVGNLTMGGTGKTPLVKWIARWCAMRYVRVAIVSRGYGAAAGSKNDEALELEQALPGVPHVQDADRVAGARTAIAQFGAQLIILDDGFQHRRLARDLDIVLLDASEPFGFEHVFPRGMLREPIESLARADVLCLTRADLLDEAGRSAVREQAARLAPQAVWCEAAHTPTELRNSADQTRPIATLANQRVAAFCGIGNPAAFRRTLAGSRAEVVYWREFPDHHTYSDSDLAALSAQIATSQATMVVVTQKDLVKLQQAELGGYPLWALVVDMQLLAGEAGLEQALQNVLPRLAATS